MSEERKQNASQGGNDEGNQIFSGSFCHRALSMSKATQAAQVSPIRALIKRKKMLPSRFFVSSAGRTVERSPRLRFMGGVMFAAEKP
jgi:hypothetical protein